MLVVKSGAGFYSQIINLTAFLRLAIIFLNMKKTTQNYEFTAFLNISGIIIVIIISLMTVVS